MDFKAILNKLDSMEAPVATPAAPKLPQAVQLNEDAQLRVLSGRTTYVAEAKKKAEEEAVAETADMKVGQKKTSSTGGEVEKTKTGLKHTAGKNYSSADAPEDAPHRVQKEADKKAKDAAKAKKKKTDESVEFDAEEFINDFNALVEAKKKSKPDYLDMDKDGDKKEPMKKAIKDKKVAEGFPTVAGEKNKDLKVGDTKKSSTGGTITKTKTGLKHSSGNNYSSADAPEDKPMKKVKEATSSTGGTITKTATGLKHTAGNKYKGSEFDPKGGNGTVGPRTSIDKMEHPADSARAAKHKKAAGIKESVERKLSFKQMVNLVQESGGQQQIDAVDRELFAWAQRVASQKFTEAARQEVFAGLVYERMGGVFEMYDVLSEDQK